MPRLRQHGHGSALPSTIHGLFSPLDRPPHGGNRRRSQLMLAFTPDVTRVLLICVEGDFKEWFESEFLVQWFPHGSGLKPATVVVGVSEADHVGHEEGADALTAVGRDYGHPVQRDVPSGQRVRPRCIYLIQDTLCKLTMLTFRPPRRRQLRWPIWERIILFDLPLQATDNLLGLGVLDVEPVAWNMALVITPESFFRFSDCCLAVGFGVTKNGEEELSEWLVRIVVCDPDDVHDLVHFFPSFYFLDSKLALCLCFVYRVHGVEVEGKLAVCLCFVHRTHGGEVDGLQAK